MMSTAILNFAKQFEYKPTVENKQHLKKKKRIIVLGMGGSHLGADVIATLKPEVPLTIHSDYGLPALSKQDLKESLIIASSYSGNTEEVIDGMQLALKQKLSVAVISVGGNMLEIAKQKKLPYVELPNTGIQPRSALGFSVIGLLALMGETTVLKEVQQLAKILAPKKWESKGKQLAKKLVDRVPVIYSSKANMAVAYNWKIKLNETGKIPAFYNVVPELNHNEMTGFDVTTSSEHLSKQFVFLFLENKADNAKNQQRMQVLKKLYKKRGLAVESIPLTGTTKAQKIFQSLLWADWTAVSIAAHYGLESEQVPMVEEFKRLIK
ncbi:MAG: hypothetical protein KBD15_02015 [Candidatus Magasanikbacteria bacterium]|nr:hypothetical protein [Candidatus Magasanikbacteria bacterium]